MPRIIIVCLRQVMVGRWLEGKTHTHQMENWAIIMLGDSGDDRKKN